MNVNTIGELKALRTELRRYELNGLADRAAQVQREIAGRVAVVRDAIRQLDSQATVADAIEDHVRAAEARAAAKELREGLADAGEPLPVEDDETVLAELVDPADKPGQAEGSETAVESAPRERAVAARTTMKRK